APSTLTDPFDDLPGDGPDVQLVRGLDRVIRVFRKLPGPVVETSVRWLGEMVRGMRIYTRRAGAADEAATLETLRDLERYGYFVAGTVGHMLTTLFLHHARRDGTVAPDNEATMRANAEQFGLGLQMVNILKDQTDDLARGRCYIPRSLAAQEELTPTELYEEANRSAAHRAVAPLFERAADHLDGALEYALALPTDQSEIRVACLVPIWMAVRTLVHARDHDAIFADGVPVKISREEVDAIVAECAEFATEDGYLRERYEALWHESVR
ncbi:MAG: squalene/phytoene synthase family protein, partial [Bradymonadaceae bacterium]